MTDLAQHDRPGDERVGALHRGAPFRRVPAVARGAPVVRRFLFRDGAVDERVGDVRVELEVPGEPAGLGWLPDGRLLVVARKPRTVHRLEADGRLVQHGDLNPTAGFYGNDMVVDAAGRAYVGNFGFDLDGFIEERGQAALVEPPGPPTTALIRIDPDGSAHIAAEDMSFPNGAVITPDGKTLIVAETLAGRLTAFDVGDRGGTHRAAGVGHRSRGARLTGSVSTPTATCGWPMPSPTSACWWPRAGTSSTGSPPPRPRSPACSGATTGARSS